MKLLVILFFTLLSFNAFSEGLPHTKLYAVTDGFCCGGEESDPHAVHGFEVINNGFVSTRDVKVLPARDDTGKINFL